MVRPIRLPLCLWAWPRRRDTLASEREIVSDCAKRQGSV